MTSIVVGCELAPIKRKSIARLFFTDAHHIDEMRNETQLFLIQPSSASVQVLWSSTVSNLHPTAFLSLSPIYF